MTQNANAENVAPIGRDVPFPTAHVHHHDPKAAAAALAADEARRRAEHESEERARSKMYVVGRVLLAAPFVLTGVWKLTGGAGGLGPDAFGAGDMDFPLGFAGVLEIALGVLLALGLKTRPVAIALIGYLGAVTLLVHHRFDLPINQEFALRNLALAGALFMVFSHGAGATSVDHWLKRRELKQFGA